jgi:hypothetical protein
VHGKWPSSGLRQDWEGTVVSQIYLFALFIDFIIRQVNVNYSGVITTIITSPCFSRIVNAKIISTQSLV